MIYIWLIILSVAVMYLFWSRDVILDAVEQLQEFEKHILDGLDKKDSKQKQLGDDQ